MASDDTVILTEEERNRILDNEEDITETELDTDDDSTDE